MLAVNVLCRNPHDDRVLPRWARYLAKYNGWTLTAKPDPHAEALYLMGYFEEQKMTSWPSAPVAALFTHREEEPPGNDKARLFDKVAKRVDLRITMCALYGGYLAQFGPTVQPALPVERERFTLPKARAGGTVVVGLSGYTYSNGRKGEDLASIAVQSEIGRRVEWRASGRGWPVRTVRYPWGKMHEFYQGLDVLLCTSLVEGGPMAPLEALSCGVSVVIPRGVGIMDELPDLPGIHRYTRGDAKSMVKALSEASVVRFKTNREALRDVTARFTVENWCRENAEAMEMLISSGLNAGIAEQEEEVTKPVQISAVQTPVERATGSDRGIYVVAFGDPARKCALRLMKSIKKWMPEIPIALCAAKKIGPEDLLIVEKDSDIGGRRAKLRAYQHAPAEWEYVLYLDADTEVVGDIRLYFQLVEDGWEFVICKDPHLMDTMFSFRRANNLDELTETIDQIHTGHTLQYNGGVWAFRRNERVARFFTRWLAEWEKHAQRDQGALIRAMYTDPLRVYVLGNEWNTFPKYTRGITTAGLMHYPGDARRWTGMIPGRIDSQTAWAAVNRFMKDWNK